MTPPQLVPIGAVYPSAYNPRKADPMRLDLIEQSLRKLGFLLPLYADADGELLSGHQRHLVAGERLGLTHVPVVYVDKMELDQRRAINVVFNRATNDLDRASTPTSITDALSRVNLNVLAQAIPNKAGDAMYPCLSPKRVLLQRLLDANAGRWKDYPRNITKTLAGVGILMPIIATTDYVVTNGIGRVQYLAEAGELYADVIFITQPEAAFSDAMLNLLSMDFDIHTRYADVLRHNSFRRTRDKTTQLATGHLWALGRNSIDFDIGNPQHVAMWRKHYGDSVLDFGAGWRAISQLNAMGVHVDVFEPYCLERDNLDVIDKGESVRVAREFLASVRRGVQWRSIFLSAVMNSVPFAKDRQHIMTILSALCSPTTTLYTYASGVGSSNIVNVKGGERLHKQAMTSIQFALDYEPNVLLGEFQRLPKMQKYFDECEYAELHQLRFHGVKVHSDGALVYALCTHPKAISRKQLREALEFEFDLPYPDGSRMGLVNEALSAFGARLGMVL